MKHNFYCEVIFAFNRLIIYENFYMECFHRLKMTSLLSQICYNKETRKSRKYLDSWICLSRTYTRAGAGAGAGAE